MAIVIKIICNLCQDLEVVLWTRGCSTQHQFTKLASISCFKEELAVL
jgi:hypothetical protein